MKRLILPLAVLLLGCAGNRMIVSVDVGSFLSDTTRKIDYAVPLVVSFPPIEVGPEDVQIPEGMSVVAEVEEADLTVRVVVDNQTGSGNVSVRIFFAAPGVDLFSTAPAGSFTTVISAGNASVIDQTIVLTPEIRELFLLSEIQFGFELEMDSTGSTVPLSGSVELEDLRVKVVAIPTLAV